MTNNKNDLNDIGGETPSDDNEKKAIEQYLSQFDKVTNSFTNKFLLRNKDNSGPKEPSIKSSSDSTKEKVTLEELFSDAPSEATLVANNLTSSPIDKTHSGSGESGEGDVPSRKKGMKKKRTKTPVKELSTGKKILKYGLVACSAMVIFLMIFSATVIASTPKIDATNIYKYLNESSIVYDQNGAPVDKITYGEGDRVIVSYDKLPADMVNAIVAVEDKTFWTHHGFNFVRLFGAVFDTLTGGGDISGTSTITQQLARNVYLSETKQVRSLTRKVAEAYYSVIIESSLSKEKIVEAYLNTVFLGYSSYGVQAASQSYFSKDVQDLTLLECVSLAAIPKSPSAYALVEKKTASNVTEQIDKTKIIENTDEHILLYNGDSSADRRALILKFMTEQKYITEEVRQSALSQNLADLVRPAGDTNLKLTAYYSDYVIDVVKNDLVEKAGYSEEQAANLIYGGGLKIYTTMDSNSQKILMSEYAKSGNFPGLKNIRYDSNKNIIGDKKQILLYPYDTYINGDKEFILNSSEYAIDEKGNMVLKAGERLNFFATTVAAGTDYSIEFKPMYKRENGVLHTIKNGVVLIPQTYKTLDANGNLVINAQFFKDFPNFFEVDGASYKVAWGNYVLQTKVRQPQSAMVITDYKTGEIKGMVGGRNIGGRLLFNRATSPRQPGSTIKPLAVYSSALQQGADAAASGTPMKFGSFDGKEKSDFYGSYWTAASGINDSALTVGGKVWPKNWYGGYKGVQSMRDAIEISGNVAAVRVYQQVGAEYASSQLEKFGVSTLVKDAGDGSANDMNPAALALGGMTRGISPLEMSSAYGTFVNKGIHIDPIIYTKVTDKDGKALLGRPEQKKTKVLDEGVAFIMADMLKSVVSSGVGTPARISGTAVGGKTGTTSDQYDIWFSGFTPQYSAAIWIGCDVNIDIAAESTFTAKTWATIMRQVIKGVEGEYFPQPSNVVKKNGEYFISGTENGAKKIVKEKSVSVCSITGYVPTPFCPSRATATLSEDDPKSKYYCYLHNDGKYEVAPGETLDPTFTPPTPTTPETAPTAPSGDTRKPNILLDLYAFLFSNKV